MLYGRMDNKVIFREFESEVYQENNGLKQVCVLSPCLFNLILGDSDDMLNGYGGVEFGTHILSGLYYADGIVIFADSDLHLEDMLKVADEDRGPCHEL